MIFNHIIVASDFLYTPIPSHSELEYTETSTSSYSSCINKTLLLVVRSIFIIFLLFSREHLKYKVIMMKYFVYNSTHVRFYKRQLDMHNHKRHGVSCAFVYFSCFIWIVGIYWANILVKVYIFIKWYIFMWITRCIM